MTRKSQQIMTALEKEILAGAFSVGELMNEVALAERFEVSRTPVREALLSLASSGLVQLEPGRGAIVVGASLEKVFESYEVLADLMSLAASLAAQRMTTLARASLRSLHEEMHGHAGKEHRDTYYRLDNEFHDAVVMGSANKVLARCIADCQKTIAGVRHASIEAHQSLEAMYMEHERIVAAITGGHAEEARRAMGDHVQLRGDRASQLISAWRLQTQPVARTA